VIYRDVQYNSNIDEVSNQHQLKIQWHASTIPSEMEMVKILTKDTGLEYQFGTGYGETKIQKFPFIFPCSPFGRFQISVFLNKEDQNFDADKNIIFLCLYINLLFVAALFVIFLYIIDYIYYLNQIITFIFTYLFLFLIFAIFCFNQTPIFTFVLLFFLRINVT